MSSLRIAIDSADAVRGARAAQEALRSVGSEAVRAEGVLDQFGRHAAATGAQLGSFRFDDPLGLRPIIARADSAIAKIGALRAAQEALRAQQALPAFGSGLETPFGAGLGGAFTAAELGIGKVTAAAAGLGSTLAEVGTVGSASIGRSAVSMDVLAASTLNAERRTAELFSLQRAISAPRDLSTSLGGTGTVIDARGLALIEAQAGAFNRSTAAAESYGAGVTRATSGATGALDLHLRTLLRFGAAIIGIRGAHAAISELIEFEAGLVGVSQATGLTGESLEDLKQKIVAFSTSGIPVATESLLKFAEAAGRAQIRAPEGIDEFVRQVAQLQVIAPGAGGGPDELGDSVTRFLRLSGEAPARVQPLADAIARLDDEFGASGAAIFATGEAVAQAGAGFIRSSADALGLGAAMVQVGVDGTQAGTVIAQVMTAVRDAVSQGGQELRTLSDLTGLTGAQIKDAFRADAASFFVTVLEGLGRQGGESAKALDDLGLASARQARVLGPLIQNTDQLRRGMQEANDAAREGVDGARDAAGKQATLGAQIIATKNLFTAATAANSTFTSGLAGMLGVVNEVASDVFGLGEAGTQASAGINGAATAIEAAVVAGASAAVIGKLAGWFAAATAPIIATDAALVGYSAAGITATTVSVGLSAAMTRLGAASLAFLKTPLGIAVAVGGAVAGLVALANAFDDIDTGPAIKELDEFNKRLSALDRAAQGLQDARDIIFRADMNGDAEARADGLRKRLVELESAAAVVSGEIRRSLSGVEKDLRVEIKATFPGLSAADVESRIREAIPAAVNVNAAIDLAVAGKVDPAGIQAIEQALVNAGVAAERARALIHGATNVATGKVDGRELIESIKAIELPGLAPGQTAELRASVANALSGATISTGKLAALKLDELFPDVEGAGLLFQKSLSDVVARARGGAQAELDKKLGFNEFGLPNTAPDIAIQLSAEDFFPQALRDSLGREVDQVFGDDVGQRIRQALDAAIAGVEIPGIDKAQGRKLSDSINAAIGLVSTGEIDDAGLQALGSTLDEVGIKGVEARQLIEGATSAAAGEVNADGFRILGIVLEQAGAGAISTTKGLAAIDREIATTNLQIKAPDFVEPTKKASDFYKDQARQINEQITQAQLALGKFETPVPIDLSQTLASQSFTGVEARIEAIKQETRAYAELMREKHAAGEIDKLGGDEELQHNLRLAQTLEALKISAVDAEESQRRLGAEQALLTGQSSILGTQLQHLGAQAKGETAASFDLLRQQIELAHAATLKGLEINLIEGTPKGEVDASRAQADAQRNAALAGVDLSESQARSAESARRLGVEQLSLSVASVTLDSNLRALADTGRGETADAFRIMRQQIELTQNAALKGIEIKSRGVGAQPDEIAAEREVVAAQHDASIAALELQIQNAALSATTRDLSFAHGALTDESRVLDLQLRRLALTGRGDTADAFAILREQIELAHAAAEKGIEIKGLDPSVTDAQIAKLKELEQRLYGASLENLRLDESAAKSSRAMKDLGIVSGNASQAITDGLLGIRSPAEAARQALSSIASGIIQPRIEKGILDLFGDQGKQVAAQKGLGDIGSDVGLDQVGVSATAASAGLDLSTAALARFQAALELQAAPGDFIGPPAPSAAPEAASVVGEATQDAGLEKLGVAAFAAVTGLEQIPVPAGLAGAALDNLVVPTGLAAKSTTVFGGAVDAATAALARLVASLNAKAGKDAITSVVGAVGGAAGGATGSETGGGSNLDLPKQQFTAGGGLGAGKGGASQQQNVVAQQSQGLDFERMIRRAIATTTEQEQPQLQAARVEVPSIKVPADRFTLPLLEVPQVEWPLLDIPAAQFVLPQIVVPASQFELEVPKSRERPADLAKPAASKPQRAAGEPREVDQGSLERTLRIFAPRVASGLPTQQSRRAPIAEAPSFDLVSFERMLRRVNAPTAEPQQPRGAARSEPRETREPSQRTINYQSTINVNGQRSPLESGQRLSLRQFERDLRSRDR